MTDEAPKVPANMAKDRFWFLTNAGEIYNVLRYESATMNMSVWNPEIGDWMVDNSYRAEIFFDPDVGEYRETTAAEAIRVLPSLWPPSIGDDDDPS